MKVWLPCVRCRGEGSLFGPIIRKDGGVEHDHTGRPMLVPITCFRCDGSTIFTAKPKWRNKREAHNTNAGE